MKILTPIDVDKNEVKNICLQRKSTVSKKEEVESYIYYDNGKKRPRFFDGQFWRDLGGVEDYVSLLRKKIEVPLGDSIHTEFIIEHKFNRQFVLINVYENKSPCEQVICGIDLQDKNTCRIYFQEPPKNDEYMAVIMG